MSEPAAAASVCSHCGGELPDGIVFTIGGRRVCGRCFAGLDLPPVTTRP